MIFLHFRDGSVRAEPEYIEFAYNQPKYRIPRATNYIYSTSSGDLPIDVTFETIDFDYSHSVEGNKHYYEVLPKKPKTSKTKLEQEIHDLETMGYR
jgi:hypothetical protein